jgi:hypothetical protein
LTALWQLGFGRVGGDCGDVQTQARAGRRWLLTETTRWRCQTVELMIDDQGDDLTMTAIVLLLETGVLRIASDWLGGKAGG